MSGLRWVALAAVASVSVSISIWSTAQASTVRLPPSSLAEVLAETEVVVEVQLGTPATTPIDLPIPPAGAKACGTRADAVWRAQVIDVVHPAAFAPVKPGQALVVFPADSFARLGLHQDGCAGRETFDPSFPWFRGAEPVAGARLLVLLRWQPGLGWREVVGGAWLSPRRRGAVRAGLARPRPPGLGARDDVFAGPAKHEARCVADSDCAVTALSCPAGPCGTCPGAALSAVTVDALTRSAARCAALRVPAPKPSPRAPNCAPCPPAPPAQPSRTPACRATRCTGTP